MSKSAICSSVLQCLISSIQFLQCISCLFRTFIMHDLLKDLITYTLMHQEHGFPSFFFNSLWAVCCTSVAFAASAVTPSFTISSTSWNLKITFIFTLHWSKFLPSKTGRCARILSLWVVILHEFSNNNERTRLCYTNLIEEDGIGILRYLWFLVFERGREKYLCNFIEWIGLLIYNSYEVFIHQVM